jgi:hypothetical protein
MLLAGITPENIESTGHQNSDGGSSGDIDENKALTDSRRFLLPLADAAPYISRSQAIECTISSDASLAGITPEVLENTGSRPSDFERSGDKCEN